MNIYKKAFFGMALWLAAFSLQAIDVTRLSCEMKDNPLALDTEVEVYTQDGQDGKSVVWNSGKVNSDQSQFVTYAGGTLRPLLRYFWRVRVWDENGKPSEWSKEAEFRLAPDSRFFVHRRGSGSRPSRRGPQGKPTRPSGGCRG